MVLLGTGLARSVRRPACRPEGKRERFCECWVFQRLLRRTILSSRQDAPPLYGRPEARRYGATVWKMRPEQRAGLKNEKGRIGL